MKILHIITALGVGGAETALCRLIEALPPPEHSHVVVSLGKEDALCARIQRSGAQLHHLGIQSSLSGLKAFATIRQLISNERADLIHGWMYHANIAASLVALRANTPVIWGIRCSPDGSSSEKLLTRFLIASGRPLSRLPRAIVYNSATSSRLHGAMGYSQARTRVIPNGFDASLFKPDAASRIRIREELRIAPAAFVVGMVARWHPVKDHATFLRAAAAFSKSCETSIFVLAGDGIDESNADLLKLIHDLGIWDRVRLCGRRTDVAAIMAAFDIGCSSSAWAEAFPNVLGEMMACGVPCVATDLGDVREIIGETGYVVPIVSPVALSARFLELNLMEKGTRRSLSDAARHRVVANYSLAGCAAAYADLYREVTRRNDVRHSGPLGLGETGPRKL